MSVESSICVAVSSGRRAGLAFGSGIDGGIMCGGTTGGDKVWSVGSSSSSHSSSGGGGTGCGGGGGGAATAGEDDVGAGGAAGPDCETGCAARVVVDCATTFLMTCGWICAVAFTAVIGVGGRWPLAVGDAGFTCAGDGVGGAAGMLRLLCVAGFGAGGGAGFAPCGCVAVEEGRGAGGASRFATVKRAWTMSFRRIAATAMTPTPSSFVVHCTGLSLSEST
ncbi:MAG: hypothetical protein KIT84_22715 [Labilithrix sp.]|nr:hypothetical protein [Labilithrix sp.]